MNKYVVKQFGDARGLTVFAPDGRIVIRSLHTLRQAQEAIRREKLRTRLPESVAEDGRIVYEEEA